MIILDGSHGEGGGSLVRVALALSTLTGKEFKVNNIRSGRPQPGLKAQHLHAIKALKEICQAETNDIKLGSSELHFKPGKIKAGVYNIDIGTAGSISLLLQALILPCMFAPGKVTLNVTGGTCGKWQASVDYLQNVLIPHIDRFVEKIELRILKRGYFPKGGGKVSLSINPLYENIAELENIPRINVIKLGNLEQIKGVVNVSTELEEKQVGERIKSSAENILKEFDAPINIRVEYNQSLSVGGGIVLWAISSNGEAYPIYGGDALIERGKKSEDIGKEAAEKLKEEIKAAQGVDSHLADQLIPYMALLPGSEISSGEITDHALTNIYVVEKFLNVKFKVEENKVSCQ